MAGLRKYDHNAILDLRAQGLGPSATAARLGMTTEAVHSVIADARRRGDARARRPAVASAEPVVADRPNVLVVHVATTDRLGGNARKAPVSLPRLSILEGWTGRVG